MSKADHIQVSVRVKPLLEEQQYKCCLSIDQTLKDTIVLEGQGEQRYFTFDNVANEQATQTDIFQHVGRPCVQQSLAGYNGCVFVYGQTGAGKTHTMVGSQEQPGVLPRALEFLFEQIGLDLQHNSSTEYLVKCSYLEIYNEHIIDLLNPSSGNLALREDLKRGVYVEYLTEESCSNFNQAINVLHKGKQNRHIASTNMNIESSRSHSVFTIHVELRRQTQTLVKNHRFARMHFVDLAGSERQKSSQAQGERLREGCNINKSLHILGNVINSLADLANQQQQRFVHYRDSKLTFLLKDSLGGNSRTHLIANVNQSSTCYQETLGTLQFAKRVKQVRNKAQINEDDSGNLDSLKAEIKRLKQELAKKTIEQDCIWETPRKDTTMVMQSQNFLQSLESESLLLGDQKYLKLEELLKCYLEQSTESETMLHLSIEKAEDTIANCRKQLKEGYEREIQLRQAVSILNSRLQHNGEENLPNLHVNPIVYRILQENFDLKEINLQIPQCGKLLQQNLIIMNSIAEMLNETIEERRRLQKQLEDRISQKYISPTKYQELEGLYEQQEIGFTEKLDKLERELAEVKLQKARVQVQFEEKQLEGQQLQKENGDIKESLQQEKLKYEGLVEAIKTKNNQAENIEILEAELQDARVHIQILERENQRHKQDYERLIEKSQLHAKDQQEVMAELELQISMLHRELRDKEVSLQRISRDNEHNRSQNISLQRISHELQQKLEVVAEAEIHDLKNKLTMITDQLEGKDQLIKDLNSQLEFQEQQQNQDLQKYKEELENLENSMKFREVECDNMNQKITKQIQQINDLEADIKGFIIQIKQQESNQKGLTQENINLQNQIQQLKEENLEMKQNLEEKTNALSIVTDDLNQAINKHNLQIFQFKNQQANDLATIESLNLKIDEQVLKIEDFERRLPQEEQSKQVIFVELVDVKSQCADQKKAIKLLQAQLKTYQENHEKIQRSHQEEQAMKSQLQTDLENQKETASTLEDRNNQLQLELNQLLLSEQELEQRLDQQTEENEKLISQLNELQNQFEEATKSLNNQEAQMNEQAQREQRLVQQLNCLKDAVEELGQENSKKTEELQQAIDCQALTQLELQKSKDMEKNLKLKLELIDREHLNKMEQLENVKLQLQASSQEIDSLSYEQKELTQRYSEVMQQNNSIVQKNNELGQMLEQSLQEKENLQQECNQLVETVQQLNQSIDDLHEQLFEINNLKQDLEGQIEELKTSKTQSSRKQMQELSQLQNEIKILNKQNQQLQATKQQQDNELTKIMEESKELGQREEALCTKIESLQVEIQSYELEVQTYENQKMHYQTSIEQLQTQIQSLISDIQQRDTDITKAKQTIKEMLDLTEANEHHAKEVKQQQNIKVQQLRQIHEEQLKKQSVDFEEERKNLKRQVTQHLENLERQNIRLVQEIKEKDQVLQDLQNKLQKRTEQYSSEKQSKVAELEAKTQQIAQLQQELFDNEQTLQKVTDRARDFCRQQEKEIDEIKDQYIRLEEEHNQIIDSNTQLLQENDHLNSELQKKQAELDQLAQDMKNIRHNEIKMKKDVSESTNKYSKLQLENSHLIREVENLQNEISSIMGHNNPAQKVRYLNSLKQENCALKQEKHQLTEQISQLVEDKNKLMMRMKLPHPHISPTRQDSDYDRVLQENMRLQTEIGKLNTVLSIPHNKKLNANTHEVEKILTAVQRLIQELVDCKSELQTKEKELQTKSIKNQSLEKDLLLMRQKYYSRENSVQSHVQYHSNGDGMILKERQQQASRKLNYQFQQ